MQAVILAAGLGSRIREYHNLPKGFISIGKDPIIVESINKLKKYGVDDILIVTGYRSDYYENLAKKTPGVSTVCNDDYESSGSLYSLYCARNWIKEDCLILESDLIYDERAIDVISRAEQSTVILLSGSTHSGDEVYVEANGEHRLITMSKDKAALSPSRTYGEFVGINKISFSDFQQLINIVEDDVPMLYAGHYEESGLVALAKHRLVYCLKIPDLLWGEIDDLTHLRRATRLYHALPEYVPVKRNVLLNPGPLTTTQTVKEALVVSDICHREKEFTDLIQGIRRDLLSVVNAKDDYTSVLFTASGTGAIEACLTSVIPSNKKIAILNNGAYGPRMIDIAQRYGIEVIEIAVEFEQPVSLDVIQEALQDPDVFALAVVHHETSSGILNPIRALGELCRQMERCFIVDAMSSYAGAEIDVYKDHIDFLCASSNKCLHGMPGLSFVIANRQRLIESEGNARSVYFDLFQQYAALEKSGEMPFTPAVQVAYALRQALDEFFVETLEGRMKRYHQNYAVLVAGMEALGFRVLTPVSNASKMLAIFAFPDDGVEYAFDPLHDYLYSRGYTIYPRKLAIPKTFRLACIGHLDKTDIHHFLEEVKVYMGSMARKQEDLV